VVLTLLPPCAPIMHQPCPAGQNANTMRQLSRVLGTSPGGVGGRNPDLVGAAGGGGSGDGAGRGGHGGGAPVRRGARPGARGARGDDEHSIMDLSAVDFMDTGSLAVIVGHWKQVTAAGGTLALAGARYRYTKTLWITGLADRLPLHESVDAAIAAGKAGAGGA